MFGIFRRRAASNAPPAEEIEEPTPQRPPFDRSIVVPIVKAVVGEGGSGPVIELSQDDSPIYAPLVAELMVMYALDYPDRFDFISARQLRENNLKQEELHAIALSNLPKRLPKIEMHGNSPCYMITAGGNFEATLLLLDELWDQLAELLPGEPMVVVPARDLLFVSGSDYEGAGEFLQGIANKPLDDNRYALSKCILVRRRRTWHVHRPAS